jgi:hypothetical protein
MNQWHHRFGYTVLSVIFTANDWDFINCSGHLEVIHVTNGVRIGLRKRER